MRDDTNSFLAAVCSLGSTILHEFLIDLEFRRLTEPPNLKQNTATTGEAVHCIKYLHVDSRCWQSSLNTCLFSTFTITFDLQNEPQFKLYSCASCPVSVSTLLTHTCVTVPSLTFRFRIAASASVLWECLKDGHDTRQNSLSS